MYKVPKWGHLHEDLEMSALKKRKETQTASICMLMPVLREKKTKKPVYVY